MMLVLGGAAQAQVPPPVAPDLDNGNILIQTLIPTIVPVVLDPVTGVKPGDATLVLRATTLVTHAAFDAIAPYHPTAVGVSSRLGRRPPSESVTNRNKNIAIAYASYRVLLSLYPRKAATWRSMMVLAGQNPDDSSTNPATAIGIGNLAGAAVVNDREHDGMNQLGDAGGQQFQRTPYADTTGYEPRNTPFELRDPTRWQPDIFTSGNGIFRIQKFVTPQVAYTRPYSLTSLAPYRSPPPVDSLLRGPRAFQRYKAQADVVLAATAALNDETKLVAELFNDKIASLGFGALFIALSRGQTLDEFVQYDFLVNMAAFDGMIVTWKQKIEWDAVRPRSAIAWIYGNRRVTAYGGPGVGTTSIRASEFQPYFGVADHPDYPSGSACFCAAHSQASRRFLGSDAFGFPVNYPAGSSAFEPGITPATNLTLFFPTFTDFEQRCARSRVNSGVHFEAAVNEGLRLCKPVGDRAYTYLQTLLNGTAPAP
ncbi:MAG: vanadium-dependent haloperoxidase [Myxococcales bacterium]|nr:vanadium-dependent haloperoxidase [Myxococcales bacterium]